MRGESGGRMATTAQSILSGAQGRILIASGNAEFRKQMATLSAGSTARTEEAVGGAHALAKLMQFPCDGVVLDRHLPDLDAEEVAHMIRQKYPRIEVQFVDSKEVDQEACEVEEESASAVGEEA